MRRKENRKPLPRIPGRRDLKDEFWEKAKNLIPPLKFLNKFNRRKTA